MPFVRASSFNTASADIVSDFTMSLISPVLNVVRRMSTQNSVYTG